MTRPSSSERDGAGPADMPRQPVGGGMVPPLSDSPDPSRSLGDGLSCDPAVMESQLVEYRAARPPMVVGMGRPDGYSLPGGEPIPSVTECLDSWHPGGADALCQWSHNEAQAGRHWRVTRDEAGDFGTTIHDLAVRLDTGEDADDLAREAEAKWSQEGVHAFREYERFKREVKPEYTHAEVTLISRRYGFGGTFDRRELDGAIGDLKGAKAPRVTMIAQLGGYSQLLVENGLGLPPRGWLLHFPRELVDPRTNRVRTFRLHTFTAGELLAGRDAFLRCLDLHRLAEELKEALR